MKDEIEILKKALAEAIYELECSGYYYDHPSLVKLREVLRDEPKSGSKTEDPQRDQRED